jgi:putative salt-induced outer membrane protein YdiY
MKHWLRAVLLFVLTLAGTSYGQSTNRWEKSASVGLTLTEGNSDTLLFTADILAARKWAHDEMNLGASAAYGENNDIKNNEVLRGFAQWNHLFTERFFSYVRLEALHDAVADVEYRITLSPGVGYYFIKNAKTRLSGEVGPGVVFEKQGDDEKTYITARIAERFEHKLNDRAKIWQSLEFLPQVDDFENFIINADVGVEAALTQKLSVRVYAQDTYDNEPAPGRKENDIKLVSALAWKF